MAIQPVGGGPSSSDYTRNAQHVGAQTEAISDDEETTEESDESVETQSTVSRSTNEEDQLELTQQRGTQAGTHTGMAQTMGRKKNRGAGRTDDAPDTPRQLELPFPQQEQKKPAGPQVPLFMTSMPQNLPPGGVGPRVNASPPGPVAPPSGNQQGPGPVGPGGSNQQPVPPGPVGPPSGGAGTYGDAAAANMAQMAQTDALQANQTYWSMAAERQKAMWKIYQMMQDLQTSIMAIIADAAAKRAKTMDSIAQKWAQVLGG
jgi:hypothetical protein